MSIAIELNEAASEAWRMNHGEGKRATVCLIHPFTADLYYDDLGVERFQATDDFEPAPKIGLMRLVEDDSIPVGEVCALSDDAYLEHLMLKAGAGDE